MSARPASLSAATTLEPIKPAPSVTRSIQSYPRRWPCALMVGVRPWPGMAWVSLIIRCIYTAALRAARDRIARVAIKQGSIDHWNHAQLETPDPASHRFAPRNG
jgi:hypothetical protein